MRLSFPLRLVLPAIASLAIGLPAPGARAQGGFAGMPVDSLPGWSRERVTEALPPFLAACPKLDFSWRAACAEAASLPPNDETAARAFVVRAFRAVPLGAGLFTGYFELEVAGARTRGGPYQYPILRPPAEPRGLDRAAIERGALAGRGLELMWLTSPADAYFLQLQGSGRIRLPGGGVVRVGYAAANGRAPVPTEALFARAGIPGNDLSIPGLRAWLARDPARWTRLWADPSYVFFRETTGAPETVGHAGALGAPLAPLRSIAVDPRQVALGSPVWLDTTDSYTGRPLQRLMLAADTGGGISGRGRADIFYGWDRRAEIQGGHMHATGRTWVLRLAGLP